MKLFSQKPNLFSWSAPPMVGAAISLVVSACSVDETATRSSLPPPDLSNSVTTDGDAEGDDDMADLDTSDSEPAKDKPGATKDETGAADDEPTADRDTSAADDVGDSESDENVMPEKDPGCRTVDDCAEGLVCVLKTGEGRCEKGVMAARGPLNQPPPPLGLLDGGVNDGSDAQ